MKTKLLQIKSNQRGYANNLDNHPGILEAGEIIRTGGLVAFPTETVYGLGANGLDPQAVKKIYQAKGRPSDNPLILHIADFSDLQELVQEVTPRVKGLADVFWPGPLTVVLKKRPHIPDEVTGALATVAVRIPAHPIARALIRAAKVPIAAPSANRSGKPSPTLAEHVIEDLNGRVEMIIDGGSCETGVESTVVDLTAEVPILLRPGGISLEDLQKVLGEVQLDVGVEDTVEKSLTGVTPRSPGMKYKHYSPEADLLIIEGESELVRTKLVELLHMHQTTAASLGIIATEEMVQSLRGELDAVNVKVIGKRGNSEEMAGRLFRILREFDQEGTQLVFVEGLPLVGLGLAVMNRLRKAAGYQIIKV